MGVRAIEGATTSRYVIDPYFPAIAVIGEEQDGNAFVGFCGGDDLVELQIDPYTRIIKQVTVLISRHYSVIDERMAIPPARDGILQANMPPQNECPALCATAYRDGLSIRISESTPTSHVRCSDVVFGINIDWRAFGDPPHGDDARGSGPCEICSHGRGLRRAVGASLGLMPHVCPQTAG